MDHFLPRATLAFACATAFPEAPHMLFLKDAGHDATVPSGTRSGYAILRHEDGRFCFCNPYALSGESLSIAGCSRC